MSSAIRFRFQGMFATILVAYFALYSSAYAQKTYRCGNSYSQTPCAGGVAIDTQDTRTEAQKNQADSITGRLTAAQKALETERLAREKKEAAQAKIPATKTPATVVRSKTIKPRKIKKPAVDPSPPNKPKPPAAPAASGAKKPKPVAPKKQASKPPAA